MNGWKGYYVGLDVHKRTIAYCVKRADGRIVDEGSIRAERTALKAWASGLEFPWVGGLEATLFSDWATIGRFILTVFLLSAPYFCGGLALALIFRNNHPEMPRLYMADLLGAGVQVAGVARLAPAAAGAEHAGALQDHLGPQLTPGERGRVADGHRLDLLAVDGYRFCGRLDCSGEPAMHTVIF